METSDNSPPLYFIGFVISLRRSVVMSPVCRWAEPELTPFDLSKFSFKLLKSHHNNTEQRIREERGFVVLYGPTFFNVRKSDNNGRLPASTCVVTAAYDDPKRKYQFSSAQRHQFLNVPHLTPWVGGHTDTHIFNIQYSMVF